MKVFPDFENELKELDPRLSIVLNPNREGIANIKINGFDICPIPSEEIHEVVDPTHVVRMDNGWVLKHKSKADALAIVNQTLESIKTEEGRALFFDEE